MDDSFVSPKDIRARLAKLPIGSSRAVADRAGVAYDTVRRIARGDFEGRISTLRKLSKAIAYVEKRQ